MKRAGYLVMAAVLAAGCGGAGVQKAGSRASADGKTGLGRIDQGERCDAKIGRESLVDLNQDEVPDVRKVYKTLDDKDEVLVCREADLNFDGVKDLFVFYEDSGQIIRDEVDLDFDKRIDIISTYAKGKVLKQEIDTNSDGLVDRVRHLKDDLPIRVEGDTDGDGQVDLWEYYQDGKLVRIGTDDDGDGRADSWSRDNTSEEPAGEGQAEETEDEQGGEEAAEAAPPEEGAAERGEGAEPKEIKRARPEKFKPDRAAAQGKTDDASTEPTEDKSDNKEGRTSK